MQTANIILALGGDVGNTIPKYNVTTAEIALLQAIHGEDAVTDVEPVGGISVTNRAERERLREIYGRATDGNGNKIIELVYPGAAARVFERLDELSLVPEQFKTVARVQLPVEAQSPAPVAKPAKGKRAKAAVPEPEPEPEDDAPDLDDMSDEPQGAANSVLE
ncbi:MAG: hypothetical protein HYU59_05770 [Magnetospirillum gryphiswaldense]|nr:hypothetical protein [Magnetospirillum gryphiswaldense]